MQCNVRRKLLLPRWYFARIDNLHGYRRMIFSQIINDREPGNPEPHDDHMLYALPTVH
ncbi:Uncharacterised protein [Vibrio cholerae]|nr:Uncharacterised protein [Vibrio cholerae]